MSTADECPCKHAAFWHGPDGCDFEAPRNPYDPRPRSRCGCTRRVGTKDGDDDA